MHVHHIEPRGRRTRIAIAIAAFVNLIDVDLITRGNAVRRNVMLGRAQP